MTKAYFGNRGAVKPMPLFFKVRAVMLSTCDRRRGVIVKLGSMSWRLGLRNIVLNQICKMARHRTGGS